MILQRLRIENYKRLHDVEINFPSIGIIGVVGANGAGKSTLFEAMLWALFRPNAVGIDNRDVVPRRAAGTTTKVELTVETSDAVYTITRSLRITSGGSQRVEAAVYRNDEIEPVVTGANPVSDYVRATLLRMSPISFTTTFFTKQKELAFFGEMGDTERRREMQRLLDLDAVERAQAKLREERTRERNVLVARTSQLNDETASRDLDADRDAAGAKETEAAATVATLQARHAALAESYEEVAARLDAVRQTQRRHDALGADRRAAETARAAAARSAEDTRQRLAHLQQRAERARSIAPERARLPTIEASLAEAEAAAAHARQVEEANRALRESEQALARANGDTEALIADLAALRDFLWDWENLSTAPTGSARARLLTTTLTAAAPLTVERVRERDALRALIRQSEEAQRATAEATTRANRVAELDARLHVQTASGDPQPLVEELTRRERALAEEVARMEASREGLRAELAKYKDLRSRWQSAEPGAECPTCGRAFDAADADIMFGSLERSINACVRAGKELSVQIDAKRAEGRQINGDLQHARERLQLVQTIGAQRERAVIEAQDAADRAAHLEQALRDALMQAGFRQPPADQQVQHLEAEIALLERAANAVGPATRLAAHSEQIERERDERRATIAALGSVTYDAEVHARLHEEHLLLIALAAESDQIAVELRAEPEERERLASAEGQGAEADAAIARLTAEITALGFDAAMLAGAQAELDAVAEAANGVQSALTDARLALNSAQKDIERIEGERARLAVLQAETKRLGASVERYNRMDDGFTDFSVALAARIQPRLGEYASDLVERMTNGRYLRLAFDTNYSPALYDGDLEKFPVGKFSGGERDVAALAARIALSQLLAARGGHTIGFMVLDEVFGSLDSERRTLVLDALAAMRDIVPQLFVISHVDDVRLSPLMDEVWTVATQPDGTSAVLRREAADLIGGLAVAAM